MKQRFTIFAAIALSLVLGTSYAQALTLADLVSTDRTLTVGDKSFSDFDGRLFSPSGSGLVDHSLSAISVSGITLGDMHGLSFTGDLKSGADKPFLAALIKYSVSSTNLITGFTVRTDLRFSAVPPNTEFPADGHVVSNVLETLGHDSLITTRGTGVPRDALITLPGLQQLTMDTNVQLHGVEIFSSVSFVNHLYQQALTPIPEPSTVLLVASGLAGLGLWRRRDPGRSLHVHWRNHYEAV